MAPGCSMRTLRTPRGFCAPRARPPWRGVAPLRHAPLASGAAAPGSTEVAFIYPGQGSQWPQSGGFLYDTSEVFREAVGAVDGHFAPLSGWSVRDVIAAGGHPDIDECYMAQPTLFALQVGMSELLASWGVRPACTVGHSAGEMAAAYISGAMPLEVAARVVHARAKWQQEAAGSGRLLVVGVNVRDLEARMEAEAELFRGMEVACINSPISTVLAGAEEDAMRVAAALKKQRVFHCLLPGNVAFHSSLLDPIQCGMEGDLAFLSPRGQWAPPAACPCVSTVTGEVHNDFTAEHWFDVARAPALFERAISTVVAMSRPRLLVEVAPSPTLRSPVKQCLPGGSAVAEGAVPDAYVTALLQLAGPAGGELTMEDLRRAEGAWGEWLRNGTCEVLQSTKA